MSVYHEVHSKLALHADIFWTNWSVFESLNPIVDPLIDPALAKDENWDDSLRISIGATYHCSESLTLRGGLAFDGSPVNDSNRTLRIPDADRIWVSIGASYHFNENL